MSNKTREVFTTVTLPLGKEATIFEGYGKHFFSAMKKTKGDSSLLIKYLIIELVLIEGKIISEEDIESMHIRDISYLSEVIGTMMSNNFNPLQ